MDWPADKLHVYILDDGRRKEFEQFAFEAGIGYKIRPDNKHAKAGNINTALKSMTSPLRGHLRLRPRAHAQLSADDHGLVPARPEAGHAADAAPLLFARSVRAQPGAVPHHSQRRRAVLRHRAGRQRLLERDLLLRLLRGAAPHGPRRDRRHRRRNRDRRRAHLAAHADERLEHGLHQHSAGGRPGHRAALGARRPAHSLGARHDPDSAHRQSALRAGPEVSAAALLLQRHVPLPVRGAAPHLPHRAADLPAAQPHQRPGLLGGHSGLRAAPPDASPTSPTRASRASTGTPSGTRSTRPCSRPTFCCPP